MSTDTVTVTTSPVEEVVLLSSAGPSQFTLGPAVQATTTIDTPVPLPPPNSGGAGGEEALRYDLVAVSSISLEHAFANPPIVYVVQDGELAMIGADYPDATHVYLVFPKPFTGTVVLNP